MSDFDSDVDDKQQPEVRELKAAHRRVLGVLLEKAFTTPEYYPLTLKAVTAGCNQKSNRSPTVSYDEDFVEEKLDELKELDSSECCTLTADEAFAIAITCGSGTRLPNRNSPFSRSFFCADVRLWANFAVAPAGWSRLTTLPHCEPN